MSGVSQGPGWWQASDLKWYPPERHPTYEAPLPPLPRGGGYTPQEPYSQSGPPKSHLGWAIVTILVSWPMGIVATVYASRVNGLWIQQRYDDARRAAKTARTWITVGWAFQVVAIAVFALVVANPHSKLHHEIFHGGGGSGSSGGGGSSQSYSYQQGYGIAGHELVQSQVSVAGPEGACEDAFNTYSMADAQLTDKAQYIQGCEDWLNQNPGKTAPPG